MPCSLRTRRQRCSETVSSWVTVGEGESLVGHQVNGYLLTGAPVRGRRGALRPPGYMISVLAALREQLVLGRCSPAVQTMQSCSPLPELPAEPSPASAPGRPAGGPRAPSVSAPSPPDGAPWPSPTPCRGGRRRVVTARQESPWKHEGFSNIRIGIE